MPNKESAKKALRSSEKKRIFNLRRSRVMKETIKEVRDLAGKGETGEAQTKLSLAYKAIDKAAKRNVIHKNKASRLKSRLSKAIKKAKEKTK